MANDRLINHTQGEAIIAALTRIAVALERIAPQEEEAPAQEETPGGQSEGEQTGGE